MELARRKRQSRRAPAAANYVSRTISLWRKFVFLLALFHAVDAQPGNIRTTLIADHSRKTFRPQYEQLPIGSALPDLIDASITTPEVDAFATTFVNSARKNIEHGESPEHFKELWYDPAYRINNICPPEKSGRQKSELVWTEPGDRLLKIIGNGVVKDGYNMFMAPGQAHSRVTNVYVALYIESMSSFKAQTMDFEVDTYLAMAWFDRRLSHNCTHPILVTNKIIADRIWQPDLYFVNSKFAYLQEVTTPNFMVIVYPDGLVFKSMRIDVTLSCSMDLKRFPMDKQECPIVIQSFAYVQQMLNLSWHVDEENGFPVGSNPEIKLNDMAITSTKYDCSNSPYPMFRGSAQWTKIVASIVMKRLVLFHIIQTYIPTGMLVVISWMSFWLDPRASPARISLTITSLLTLTTMSNGARQDLPQVSYIKALDIWLTFSQGLIFLVLLEYSFVSYYMTKRSFDCIHRTVHEHRRLTRVGSTVVGGLRDTDEDPRFNNSSENNDKLDDIPFRKNSFLDPMTGTPPTVHLNGASRRRTPSFSLANGGHNNTAPTPPPFSLSQGLGACASNSAVLMKGVALEHEIIRRASWLERAVEDAALMSATPHAAAHIFNKFDFTKPCQKCALANEHTARKIDTYSRVVFPVAFILFSTAYWLYYSTSNDDATV